MKNQVLIGLAVTALTLLAVFYTAQDPTIDMFEVDPSECTAEMQARCAVDLERTAKNCAEVFITDGASIISDIKCYRDIQNDRKKCLPCLCKEAEEKGWKNLEEICS